MIGNGRRRGPLWRLRRKWASLGLLGRILTVALGLLATFVLLGGILSAVDSSDSEPGSPATSDTPAVGASTALPSHPVEMPTVAVTETVTVAPSPPPTKTVTKTAEDPEPRTTAPAPDVYYENCDEARAAGAAPLHRGDPGYGPHLDRDGDGVACEPYAGP
ncbi:excalibur calcium-binding domain-containing protein [Streptomyces sp. A2-16]|uniref:excalibur calcium-binding domain-containing protein n=1 Tax=Streptomyces sp. A2-16 TaxID=2781734 RepID=UPI001BB4F456|nr:excalibur calcium-binding domain-containing protein [Streptomyces sp. A2-16]QUC62617.1 excalibur calcium-binding domain-containing protein [Streptomyces sp. A2-16]